ncbi:PQQ-binding-like beta-propeller repeat protein [Ravibacter arvi]
MHLKRFLRSSFTRPGFWCILLAGLINAACQNDNRSYTGWTEYLGGPDRNHYSELDQLSPENVANLQVAWSYSTPDSGQMQTSPIVVDSILYGVTPGVRAFAIHAATGKEIWTFGDTLKKWSHVSRGVTFWKQGKQQRIFIGIGHHLYAVDAITGKPATEFGDGGKLDLRTGYPEIAKNKYVVSTTPPALFENILLLSVRLSEDTDAAPGDIRAFDAASGKHLWTFHTIPHPGEEGYETFPQHAYLNKATGAANNWTGMAIDTKRGMVFVPTGSTSYDFFGGNRAGQNLYANSLLALDVRTGRKIWHYQTIHHDLWDRDLPAPPNLVRVKHEGQYIDAVAQVTKHGYVFLFNRENGTPLFPIEEIPVPTDGLPGEVAWPTQPIPVKPAPFARQAHQVTENDINPYAVNRDELLAIFKKTDRRQFAPPGTNGSLILPGFDGGAEWGGAAAVPQEGILYVNSNEMPWILTMVPTPADAMLAHLSPGEKVYTLNCATCHQADRSGNQKSGYPSLIDIGRRQNRGYLDRIISGGKGMMPGFTQLTSAERQSLIDFLLGEEKTEAVAGNEKHHEQLPFKSTGYHKFLDRNGLPGIAPPWGTLNAIDLNTGEYLWKIPLGELDSLKKLGVPATGLENYGGPLVTGNGLLFIAATKDEKFRAFDRHTGKLLWETQLPASGFATPITYRYGGKQYVVIACGGTKLGTRKGNQYVSFALP